MERDGGVEVGMVNAFPGHAFYIRQAAQSGLAAWSAFDHDDIGDVREMADRPETQGGGMGIEVGLLALDEREHDRLLLRGGPAGGRGDGCGLGIIGREQPRAGRQVELDGRADIALRGGRRGSG